MTIELPAFRLGLAGYSLAQQEELSAAVQCAATGATVWEIGDVANADALWINGARVQSLGDGRVRVAPANPWGRSLQLHLPDLGRPVAFSEPLGCPDVQPLFSFDAASQPSVNAVIEKFDAWVAPVAAQFCLASNIVEHQTALGAGIFEVSDEGRLLALVNMHGDIGFLPTAGPSDFEDAVWRRRTAAGEIPEHFGRTSLEQLMWQYAARTQRDLLPRHYRTDPLYFRRPPRLPQRMLADSHLLLMRELVIEPASFDTLLQRCGMDEVELAHELATLYFVGSITSNPKRAARRPLRHDGPEPVPGPQSCVPSGLDCVVPGEPLVRYRAFEHDQLTAPAPLGLW